MAIHLVEAIKPNASVSLLRRQVYTPAHVTKNEKMLGITSLICRTAVIRQQAEGDVKKWTIGLYLIGEVHHITMRTFFKLYEDLSFHEPRNGWISVHYSIRISL